MNLAFPKPFLFGFAVFSLGAVCTLPVAFYPLESAGAFARFTFTTVVWFGLGAVVLRSRRHVEIAIGAWIVSVAVSGLGAIAQVALGPNVFAFFTTVSKVAGAGQNVSFVGREIGLSGHPNDLGGAAAVAVPPAILFAMEGARTSVKRFAFIGLLCLVFACIILSGSVTAFAAGVVGAVTYLVISRISTRQLVGVIIMTLLAGASLVLINQSGSSSVATPLDRVAQTLGPTNAPDATAFARLNLDAIAWDQIVRSPIYGVGLDGASNAEALGGMQVHNMFLFAWVGAGIFGFLGLLTMVVSLLASNLSAYRRSVSRQEGLLVLALGISFMSFVIVTLAQPVLFIRYGWVHSALFLPVRALQRARDQGIRPEVALNQGILAHRHSKSLS